MKTDGIPVKPPFGIPIFWGRRGAGKTLIALNSPWQPVHVIDVENSSIDYEEHMDRLIEMGYFKNRFTRAICTDLKSYRDELIRLMRLPANSIGTIALDTAGQIADWIGSDVFTHDPGKADKMQQVLWGEVRRQLRQMLLSLSSVAPCVILTAHERAYKGEFSPRCNPGILELTSISFRLVRPPNQQKPDGLNVYSRLPFFPPRIPEITLEKMLTYMQKPANWEQLDESEKAPVEAVHTPNYEDISEG